MAVPQIAGVIALMLHANRNLTPAQIKRILAETANRSDIIV
ncbi:MAG: S8 family serine peptidase [Microcoleus sp.]